MTNVGERACRTCGGSGGKVGAPCLPCKGTGRESITVGRETAAKRFVVMMRAPGRVRDVVSDRTADITDAADIEQAIKDAHHTAHIMRVGIVIIRTSTISFRVELTK